MVVGRIARTDSVTAGRAQAGHPEVQPMKASTVFALALALLIGLAAAAGAKYAGLFNKKVEAAPLVQPPVPNYALVPRLNLYEDVTVTQEQVAPRPLRPEEEQYLAAKFGAGWRDKLLP